MTTKKRRLLTASLIAFFLILAPILTLYAYGWRFSFRQNQLVKIGGIFLKGVSTEATISLNGKEITDRTNRLLTGTLIAGLLPDTYLIKIEQDGYQIWEKNIIVKPALVAETQSIVLAPNTEPISFFKKPLKNFWINGPYLVYQNNDYSVYLTKIDDLENRVNISLMFTDLKEKILGLPGMVPILEVIERENPNELTLNTAKSSYLLDFKKLTLEILEDRAKPIALNLPETRLKALEDLAKKIVGEIGQFSYYPDGSHVFAIINADLYFIEFGNDGGHVNYWLIAEDVAKYDYENGKIYFYNNQGVSYLEI